MVRRRSTVRFRNGAPAHEAFRTSGLLIKCQTKCLRRSGYIRCAASVFGVVAEDGVHDARAAADGGHDHVPVHGLSNVGGLVPHGVADLLERHAVAAHDRYGRVPVGFQNSAAGPGLGFYAARSYSLMRPPRTGRRWMRLLYRSATG